MTSKGVCMSLCLFGIYDIFKLNHDYQIQQQQQQLPSQPNQTNKQTNIFFLDM